MDKKILTTKERISFTVAAFGRSGIYTIMSMFLLRFYTDAAGIDPIVAGYIILGGRIFDAANDPLMGYIVDHTKSKWGKMRPYLLFSPIPIAVATILLFFTPSFDSMGAKIAYAAVTYILWTTCFTVQDVPFWALSSVITPIESERTSFISTARLGSTAGGILPTVLVPVFIADNALGLKKGFFISAIIFAVIGSVLSSLAFFNTKERVEQTKDSLPLKTTVKAVASNKVLIIVILSTVLGSTTVMANVSASYVYNYLITDSGIIPKNILLTVMTVAIGVGMVPAMALLPLLRKKFSLKAIYIGASAFGVISHLALWFIGYSNIYVLLICFIFMGVPLGIYNVITYALIADSSDYSLWKSGVHIEGICFSFQTFLSTLTAGIATFATSVVLKVSGFVQPINDIVQQQSQQTRNGLFFMITLLPAIGFVLAALPMFFNDYTGKRKEEIQAELAGKK